MSLWVIIAGSVLYCVWILWRFARMDPGPGKPWEPIAEEKLPALPPVCVPADMSELLTTSYYTAYTRHYMEPYHHIEGHFVDGYHDGTNSIGAH